MFNEREGCCVFLGEDKEGGGKVMVMVMFQKREGCRVDDRLQISVRIDDSVVLDLPLELHALLLGEELVVTVGGDKVVSVGGVEGDLAVGDAASAKEDGSSTGNADGGDDREDLRLSPGVHKDSEAHCWLVGFLFGA